MFALHSDAPPATVGGPAEYADRLAALLLQQDWTPLHRLAEALTGVADAGGQAFVCGNGGSAANAQHWATDFLYPMTRTGHRPLRFTALTANAGVLTCLANDAGYDEVFSRQLDAFARTGDLLIVLSGSGNSPNVLRALEVAQTMGVGTFAIVGYSGGTALQLADDCLHVAVDDMQLAEDVQLVAGHMVMRLLLARPPAKS